MQKFKTLSDAIALAEFAHRNQTDKAGLDYIEHPRRVMQSVQAQGGLPYVQMGAILHDVTEDTAFTTDMLLALGFPEGVVEIVRLLDRGASEAVFTQNFSRSDGIDLFGLTRYREMADEFYYLSIKDNPGAKMVKLADINDNLQEWRLSYLPIGTQDRLRAKYAKAKEILL